MKTNFKNLIKNQNGFTFIELIVVISIFAIMSGVVIFKFDDFSSNITLQNLSHDIALRIKKAQNEAIFGQSNTIGQQNFGVSYTGEYADRYAPTYGIHFSPDNNKQFTFFADRQFTYNGTYDIGGSTCNSPGGGTECLEDVNIQGSETITELCVNVTTVGSCVDLGGTIINDYLDITFKRPFPEARIFGDGSIWDSARIKLTSASGKQNRYVFVTRLGQITAQ